MAAAGARSFFSLCSGYGRRQLSFGMVTAQKTQMRYKSESAGSGYVIQKTSMNIHGYDPKVHTTKDLPLYITRYSTQGFMIQGNRVVGSVAILPKSFFSWKVKSAADITPQSLQLFTVVQPRIEILVIGCGDKVYQLPAEVRQFLKKYRIAVEVLDTPNACATFNFLTEEERVTGAVLIPPQVIPL